MPKGFHTRCIQGEFQRRRSRTFACREIRDDTQGGIEHNANMSYWVYILASRRHGALYVGVTSDLERRIAQHREKRFSGFTATYNIARLVYAQGFGEVTQAIAFEKRLKRWRRDWKVRLIEADNPHWEDLYLRIIATPPLHPDIAAAIAQNAQPTP